MKDGLYLIVILVHITFALVSRLQRINKSLNIHIDVKFVILGTLIRIWGW